MGVFIQREWTTIQTLAKYAAERSVDNPGYDYRYFLNCSNAYFLKAENEGLHTQDGKDYFLMAAWLAMAASEVDGFQYAKYKQEQRQAHRAAFYDQYVNKPELVWIAEEDDLELEARLGKFAIESSRFDLIPTVALERLGIHNELCGLKWEDANQWMREGFVVSRRIDSMKRHFESLHAKDPTEDHIAHLIWGFMAITHVCQVFPHRNDLVDYETVRKLNVTADEAAKSQCGLVPPSLEQAPAKVA